MSIKQIFLASYFSYSKMEGIVFVVF